MIKVEPLNSQEVRTLHQIQREVFQSYRQFFPIFPPRWETIDDFQDYLRGKEVLVVRLNGIPRGFLVYFTLGETCVVDRICITQSSLPTELFSVLIEFLEGTKEFFQKIYLELPLPLSEMITHFLNLGFAPCGIVYRYSPACPFIGLQKGNHRIGQKGSP